MSIYQIVYRRNSDDNLHTLIVKAADKESAKQRAKEIVGENDYSRTEATICSDESYTKPFISRHTDTTASLALHNKAYQRYRLINRQPRKG